MKRIAFAITLALVTSPFVAFGEESSASATSAPTHEWHGRGARMLAVWNSLTPEEQAKLKAARKTAKANPEVAQARAQMTEAIKTFRETRKTAMLKADPTLAPVLEKFQAARKDKPHQK